MPRVSREKEAVKENKIMANQNNLKPHHKIFETCEGKFICGHERCCLFCKNCTDITLGWDGMPYMTFCELTYDDDLCDKIDKDGAFENGSCEYFIDNGEGKTAEQIHEELN